MERTSSLLMISLMLAGGIAVAVQPSINSRLAQKIGVIESSCISFAVGTLTLFALSLVMGRGSYRLLGGASWWELTGGLLGAFFVTMTIVVVPRLGTAAAMAAIIAAQLTAGLLLDHFGWFGLRTVPVSMTRGIGVLLLFAGAILIFRR